MNIVNRKMKSILTMVIVLCFMTLSVVGFLYIRGTLRLVNQAKEKEKSAYKVTQEEKPSQEAAQTKAKTEEEIQAEQGIQPGKKNETEQETQTEQDPSKVKKYQLYDDIVWTVGTVNLYEEDEESSKVICQIPGQTKLERIGASNEWALVRGKGLQGFVHQEDVSIVEP